MKCILVALLILTTANVAQAENLREILNCNNGALSLYRNLDTSQNRYGALVLIIRDPVALLRLQRDLGVIFSSEFKQSGWNASGDIASEAQNTYYPGPIVNSIVDFKSFIGAGPIFNSVAHGYRAHGGLQLVYQTSGNEPPYCEGGIDDHEGHCIGGHFVQRPARELSDWFYPNCQER